MSSDGERKGYRSGNVVLPRRTRLQQWTLGSKEKVKVYLGRNGCGNMQRCVTKGAHFPSPLTQLQLVIKTVALNHVTAC